VSTATIDQNSCVDALFVGTVFLDVVMAGVPELPAAGAEVWAQHRVICPGGIANNAVAAARLGMSTALVAAVGDDEAGELAWANLAREHDLDLRWATRVEGLATAVTVALTHGEERRFISHGVLDPVPVQDISPALPRSRTCFVSIGRELPVWVREQRAAGSIAFGDVGWDARNGWSASVLDNLAELDVFLPNHAEAMAYTGTHTPRQALHALGNRVPLAVVTCGPRGAIALDSATGHEVSVDGLTGSALDPTGAGDVFVVAFMRATLAGLPLQERMTFAALCAGLSVRRLGGAASAPRLPDLRAWADTELPPDAERRYDFLPQLLDTHPVERDPQPARPADCHL